MDIKNLLKSLNDAKVDYVIIGAMAMPAHGFARVTVDIDIFVRPVLENFEKCIRGLKEFGYDLQEITAQDLLKHKILIRQYIVETDIHPFVTGVTFDEIWNSKVLGQYEGVEVYFAGLDSLIKMKKAANRPKDQEDLKFLEQIKKSKK